MPDDGADRSKPPRGSERLALELTKAFVWPVFAFAILFAFWGPLHQIVESIPELLGRSESISLSGLSIRMTERLASRASRDVREVLKKLAADDIGKILAVNVERGSTLTFSGSFSEDDKKQWGRLVRVGLFREMAAHELKTDDRYGVQATRLVEKTREFLLQLVSELISETRPAAADTARRR